MSKSIKAAVAKYQKTASNMTTHKGIVSFLSKYRHNEVSDEEIMEEYHGVSLEVGHAIENWYISSKGLKDLHKAMVALATLNRRSKKGKADLVALEEVVLPAMNLDEYYDVIE